MKKLMIKSHPAEKPLLGDASPIKFVPGEVLLHTFDLGDYSEKQRLLLCRVNKRFRDLIRTDGRLLLQSQEVLEDIGEFAANQKNADALFDSQAEEIKYLLDNETSIYNKNHAAQNIQEAFDDLRKLPQKKDYYSLYLRHKALNHINICIILNCLHINQNDNMALLSNLHLTRFPTKLLNDPTLEDYWSNITILDLEDNMIRKIPNGIYKLSNLRQLWISNNQLHELPSSMARMLTLKQLKARGNFIVSVANVRFEQMDNLESLIMSDNQLLEIPATLAKIPKLKTLHISGNCLLDLPDTLAESVLIMSENGELHFVTKEKILASQQVLEKENALKICLR
jgi:Leucine-rich repeat (LRR) protein